MKRLLYLLIIPLIIGSCDKIDDANTIDFDTTIAMDMSIAVADASAIVLKSTADFAFSESEIASLYQDPEIMDYLDKIKSIEVENIEITFYGLESGAQINSITLSVSNVGDIVTLENITSSNATHNPSISGGILTQVAEELENNWEIIANVTGTTNTAPMWFNIYLTYDLHIEAKAL